VKDAPKTAFHSVRFYCKKCARALYIKDPADVPEEEASTFTCRETPVALAERLLEEGHVYCTFCDLHYKVMRFTNPKVLPLTLYPV
jgi:hypothetical protein